MSSKTFHFRSKHAIRMEKFGAIKVEKGGVAVLTATCQQRATKTPHLQVQRPPVLPFAPRLGDNLGKIWVIQ